ncbi:MAG: hypothetical protein RI842_10270 [Schleiferiaceae bacterium]|jgi:hypothetical protein|nr:hypothetical protein [Schleiferiaceae bacterium]MDR9443092.1 hypothetical protein [Schleiferiaceae bacterium]
MNYSRCINTALSSLLLLASFSLGAQDWVGKKHLSLGVAGVNSVYNYGTDENVSHYGGGVHLSFSFEMFSFLEGGFLTSLEKWEGEHFIGTSVPNTLYDVSFNDTFNTRYNSRLYWNNNLFIAYNFNEYIGLRAGISVYDWYSNLYQAKRDNQVVYSYEHRYHHFFNNYSFSIYGQYEAFRAALFFRKAFDDDFIRTFGLRLTYRYSFD